MALAAAMTVSMAACGSGDGGDGSGVSITIFNSKVEIQDQFEEMAKEYSEATGVNVEVYYSGDTVAAHMATKYSSNDPYTIAMVDAKDIYSLAEEHAVDLSGEDWVANTNYAISVGGKVVGFPVCIEARGKLVERSVLFIHHPWDLTQVIRLSGKYLYLLSQFPMSLDLCWPPNA